MEISRHQRRIFLVQAIFLWEDMAARKFELKRSDHEGMLRYIWEHFSSGSFDRDGNEFDLERFFGMIEHIDDLRKKLSEFAPDWPLEKVASADRAVLYLGLYELLYTDVPAAVAINEAVDLAKEFGGERSSKFVNGVLSSANKQHGSKETRK